MYRPVLAAVTVAALGAQASWGQLLVPQSMYGMNTHLPTDAMLAKMQSGNIAWARIDVNWYQIETSKGSFNWAGVDLVVNSANQRGIFLFPTLAYTPGWANGGQGIKYPPTDPNNWKDFVRTTVNRYKNSIKYWGLWNEPDHDHFFAGSWSDYVNKILIPGAQAIREADPTAYRVAPDVAGDENWLRNVLSAGKDYIDVITVHKYDKDGVGDVMWDLDHEYKPAIQNAGAWGKAVWLTEVGWPTTSGCWITQVSESTQASRYVGLLNEVRARDWLQKVTPYELWSDAAADCDWGILRNDLSQKQAYGAYRDYVTAHPPSDGVTVTDLRRYALANFAVGSQYFSDRPYTITSMPAYLTGAPGIQTANDDKGETGEAWIDFDPDRDADVYLAYDHRASALPDWMSGYLEMADVIGVSDTGEAYAKLYRKTFPLGEVVLGANMAPPASGADSNYFVLILPGHTGPPGKAANPNPPDLSTGVALNADLSWTAAVRAASYDLYFGTTNPPPLQENVTGTTYDPGTLSTQTVYFWRVDPVNAAGGTRGDLWTFTTGSNPGDLDGDGDVDQEDFGLFQACFSGSGTPHQPGCEAADLDPDQDVDQSDFTIFDRCMSGPHVPADPNCAD